MLDETSAARSLTTVNMFNCKKKTYASKEQVFWTALHTPTPKCEVHSLRNVKFKLDALKYT